MRINKKINLFNDPSPMSKQTWIMVPDNQQCHKSEKLKHFLQNLQFCRHHIFYQEFLEQCCQWVLLKKNKNQSKSYLNNGTGYPTTWHNKYIVSLIFANCMEKPYFLSIAFGAILFVGSVRETGMNGRNINQGTIQALILYKEETM